MNAFFDIGDDDGPVFQALENAEGTNGTPDVHCEVVSKTHTHTQKHFGDGVALQMTGFQMKMIRIKKSYVCVLGCLPLYQMYIIGGLTKPFGTKWVHFYDPGSGVVNLHDFQWFSSVEGLERSHHLFSSVTKNQPT